MKRRVAQCHTRRVEGGALEARGLCVHFDGVKAIDGVDVRLRQDEILGLIGPNGAGKTTLVNALSGFQKPSAGEITLNGANVTRASAHRRVRMGVARTFQAVRLFTGLTVLENVEMSGVGIGMTRRTARRRAWEILDRLDLASVAGMRAVGIPYGHERRLGIARALASDPSFMLLDEPAAGLNEGESAELVDQLRTVHADYGCGLMVIEHDMSVIMRLCERIHVIDHGKTLAVGTPAEIRTDDLVLTAYLGHEPTAQVPQ